MKFEYNPKEEHRINEINFQNGDIIEQYIDDPEFSDLQMLNFRWEIKNEERVKTYDRPEYERKIRPEELEELKNLTNEQFLQWWVECKKETPHKVWSAYRDEFRSRFSFLDKSPWELSETIFELNVKTDSVPKEIKKEMELALSFAKPIPSERFMGKLNETGYLDPDLRLPDEYDIEKIEGIILMPIIADLENPEKDSFQAYMFIFDYSGIRHYAFGIGMGFTIVDYIDTDWDLFWAYVQECLREGDCYE